MNKYEIRAEAVLEKKEKYLRERERKIHRTVTVIASVACVGAVIAVAAMFKTLLRPIDVLPHEPTRNTTVTVDMTVALGYEGKKIFIDTESKNYGEFRTCYVNDNNEEDARNESNKFGVIDKNGNVVVPPVYGKAYAVGEDRFIVEKWNNGQPESALVDKDGNIIYGYFIGYLLPDRYGEEIHVMIVDTFEGDDFLIDTNGKRVLDIEFGTLYWAHTTGWDGYNPDETVAGISNGKYYLINYKGEIVHIFGEEPTVKESLGEGFNLIAAYRNKRLCFGVSNKNGEEIIPCEYPTLYFTGDRFVCRDGDEQGLGPHDIAVIYDTDGNVVCEGGKFSLVTIEYGAETGIGTDFNEIEWSDELMVSLGGNWVVDKNGNKLSDEYDRIEKNSDGTYTAYYADLSKTHLLDSYGKIIE